MLGRRIHVDHHMLLGPLPAPPASNNRGGCAGLLLLLLLATLTRGVAVPVVRISVAVIKEVVVLLLQLLLDVDQGQIGPLPVKKSNAVSLSGTLYTFRDVQRRTPGTVRTVRNGCKVPASYSLIKRKLQE
jgi:hypothetical protein